jgi:cation diffusion facilitator family transporter
MGAGHTHAPAAGTASAEQRRRLAVVLGLTVAMLAAEVVGSVFSGSLALLADAGHMATDAAGIALALGAVTLAQRPARGRRTFGWQRAEILAAVANGLLLLAVAVYVLVAAVRRIGHPPTIGSGLMLVIASVGLAVNLLSLAVLHGGRDASLNVRGAYLEVLGDALGSVAVIVAAVVIALTGWTRADGVASLLIGALIIPRTVKLLRDSVNVLLESTPVGMELSEVREHLLRVPHVHEVHDLHASQVATGLPVLTVHAVVDDECFHDGHLMAMLDELQDCLSGHFDVQHSTIQFEAASHWDHERAAHR